jgi:hypothetical protein
MVIFTLDIKTSLAKAYGEHTAVGGIRAPTPYIWMPSGQIGISDGAHAAATSNLVDVWNRLKETPLAQLFALLPRFALPAILLLGIACSLPGECQTPANDAKTGPDPGPPPSSVGVFPLSQVHRGLKGVAWTVFEGTAPEPMDVEILGVLRGARGPGRDMILARLHGEKPEYTGVVAGMSGSPVYIDGKLAGALSYRIGQFSKDPIAGITPIEQMLQVRDLPMNAGKQVAKIQPQEGLTVTAMETPLLMSGFEPEAIRVWKEHVAGTGLDTISAGGPMGQADPGSTDSAPIVPGSAVSLQLVSGDLEIAATCTVTYVDPKQLLACGHPIQQSGTISAPMTSAEVVATLASPLNAFKIVNTGRTVGAFTEDRDAAIRGEFGVKATMIPVSIAIDGPGGKVERKVEVVDLPSLTPSAVLVSVYQILLQTNQSTATSSYHVTGEIKLRGGAPVPVDSWGTPNETMASQLNAALGVGDAFTRLYSNSTRLEPMESVHLHIETIPQDVRTELESVRLISSSIVHSGDTVVIEATLRPWQKPARNVRVPFTIPATLEPGTLRLLIGGAGSLDRTLEATRPQSRTTTVEAASSRIRSLHAGDQLYVSMLLPQTEVSVEGEILDRLPLSMANTLESQHSAQDVDLHGESLVVAAAAPAGGVLNGQQVLTLRVESGAGLH